MSAGTKQISIHLPVLPVVCAVVVSEDQHLRLCRPHLGRAPLHAGASHVHLDPGTLNVLAVLSWVACRDAHIDSINGATAQPSGTIC